KKDGSNFTDWFEKECRQLTSFDGTPVTYEPFLLGAYAGLSPPVLPGYSMYSKLKEVAEQLGLAVPERTFVIYGNDRSPTFEFFCYSENGLTKPAELQTELQRP
ncbi:MAG: hypothetical protein PHU81_02665, partial [Acidobacteriota bacterium]|nr:hypothetical protein [Acidobacteriota bacterium]